MEKKIYRNSIQNIQLYSKMILNRFGISFFNDCKLKMKLIYLFDRKSIRDFGKSILTLNYNRNYSSNEFYNYYFSEQSLDIIDYIMENTLFKKEKIIDIIFDVYPDCKSYLNNNYQFSPLDCFINLNNNQKSILKQNGMDDIFQIDDEITDYSKDSLQYDMQMGSYI